MSDQELAYVAGFFDGEGCACICKNFSVKIMVSQKLPEVLFWLKVNFGGNVYPCGKNQGAAKWGLYNKKELLNFFIAIKPFLRIKLVEVNLCIKMLELSSDNFSRPQEKNGLYAKNPNEKERAKIYQDYLAHRKFVREFKS